jgi:hypothetical protein
LVVGLGTSAVASRAEACGGCFAPPGVPQVVTDHRMVLAVHATETVLWDQFQYAGDPRDFSWIFPLRYTDDVRLGVGTDAWIESLGNLTAPVLYAPPWPYPPCPVRYCYDASQGGWADAASVQDASGPVDTSAPPPVTVLREEVVGPYEVRIIRGDDPMAIRTWLRANGYAVPTAIEPVIDFYTGLSMDYIALRLRPEQGLNRMAPIRIRFPGAMPRLPLRMIAAGVADRVGLNLVVLADGRYEADNFPNAAYSNDDFTWDWQRPGASPLEQFVSAFNRHNNTHGGRVWLTETVSRVNRGRFAFLERTVPGVDSGTVLTPEGRADLDAAFGMGTSRTATRLRANLPAAMLDRDLVLRASDGATNVQAFSYGRQVNIPPPPTCPNGAVWNPNTRQYEGGTPFAPCDGGTEPGGFDASAPGWDAGATARDAGSARRDGGGGSIGFDAGPGASVLDAGAGNAADPVETVAHGGCAVSSTTSQRPWRGLGVAVGVALWAAARRRRRAKG